MIEEESKKEKTMFKRSILVLMLAVVYQSSSQADSRLLDHEATKSLVRLSLWYEGPQSFNKSAFRPGAAENMIHEVQETQTPVITEELAVTLEYFDI